MTSHRAPMPTPLENGLMDLSQAHAYMGQRIELGRRLPASAILKLDQQLLWWHVHDLLERFPALGGFDLHGSAALYNWSESGGGTPFRGLRVMLYRMGQAEPLARVPKSLVAARREIDTIMEGFARIHPDVFLDLVTMLPPCRRQHMAQWGHGWLDGQWLAAVEEDRLEQALPESATRRQPSPRL